MKRNQQFGLLCGLALIGCIAVFMRQHPSATSAAPTSASVGAYFSPNGGCTDAICGEIDAARSSIRIQAYSFTSKPIAESLITAIKRGVRVSAILDKSNATDRYSTGVFLKNAGADVSIDARHAIAHNKIMIIDDATLITGSFNFTRAAEESNGENMLVIKGYPDLVRQYIANWDAHLAHSNAFAVSDAAAAGSSEKRRPAGDATNRKPGR